MFDLDWRCCVPVGFGLDPIVGDNYHQKRDEPPRAGLGLTLRIGPTSPTKGVMVYLPVVVKFAVPAAIVVDSDRDGIPEFQD